MTVATVYVAITRRVKTNIERDNPKKQEEDFKAGVLLAQKSLNDYLNDGFKIIFTDKVEFGTGVFACFMLYKNDEQSEGEDDT